jgi:hypothetical protein
VKIGLGICATLALAQAALASPAGPAGPAATDKTEADRLFDQGRERRHR